MKPILLVLYLLPFAVKAQPIQADVQVTFNLPEQPKQLYISIPTRQKFDSIPFPENNQWTFKDTIAEPCQITLYIGRTTAPIQFWADDKPVRITCNQISNERNQSKLVIKDLTGSRDVLLFNGIGNGLTPNYPIYYGSLNHSQSQNDSMSTSLWNAVRLQFIDSIFNSHSESPVIPDFILFYKSAIGPEAAGQFYYRLSDKIQNSIGGKKLKKYLDLSVLLIKGELFDDFTMTDHKMNHFQLSSVKAKYILLDFWASWCSPCRYDNKFILAPMYKTLREKGLEIVSISFDNSNEKWQQAIWQDEPSWTQVCDLKGDQGYLFQKYKLIGLPFYVLLDSNRKVIDSNSNINEVNKTIELLLSN